MTVNRFFELFLEELEQTPSLQGYYKFLGKKSSFQFRKNYFLERLRYIEKNIITNSNGTNNISIWDCGCGYGTTCLYLAMNGIKTYGTTLEFYYDAIDTRKKYWGNFGNTSLFECSFENLFEHPPTPERYDFIIVQDTLHHLEPIDKAIKILNDSLKQNGKLLAIEENGNNLVQRLKLYKYRGNKLIIEMWDERLKKNILIGNENIRSLNEWTNLFKAQNLFIDKKSIQYIRYFFPFNYKFIKPETILIKERMIQTKSSLKREYFFFGLNFMIQKNKI